MNAGGNPREARDERQDYRCPSQAAGCQEARRPAGGNGAPGTPRLGLATPTKRRPAGSGAAGGGHAGAPEGKKQGTNG